MNSTMIICATIVIIIAFMVVDGIVENREKTKRYIASLDRRLNDINHD